MKSTLLISFFTKSTIITNKYGANVLPFKIPVLILSTSHKKPSIPPEDLK